MAVFSVVAYYEIYYEDAGEYWVIFALSCIILLTLVAIIIANACGKLIGKAPKTKQIETVKVSRIETELLEIKRLYENNIITDEEYSKIRASVISKYFK